MEVQQVPTVALLAGKTRTNTAVKVLGEAKERCEELEMQVKVAFTELYRAIDQNASCGIEAEVTLAFPLGVAWDAWRRDHERREAVREDMDVREKARNQ